MKPHELCKLMPPMSVEETFALEESIARTNGNEEPILIYGSRIIDGWHRFQACERTGKKPLMKEWRPKSDDPILQQLEILAIVESKNTTRRHLDASQRALCIETFRRKHNELVEQAKKNGWKDEVLKARGVVPHGTTGTRKAAESAEISRTDLIAAGKVLDHGSAALQEAVKDGEVAVRDAAKVTDLPKSEQTEAVKKVRKKKAKTVTAAAKADDKPEEPKKPETPFDLHIARCDTVLKQFVPKMQEFALEIERQIGAAKGNFSPGKISNAAKIVHEQYEYIRPLLLNAQQKYWRTGGATR